jgi:hypothetical protein
MMKARLAQRREINFKLVQRLRIMVVHVFDHHHGLSDRDRCLGSAWRIADARPTNLPLRTLITRKFLPVSLHCLQTCSHRLSLR